MGHEPQTIRAPDGSKMVVLPQAEYDRLVALAEDAIDIADAQDSLERIRAGEGTVPGEVVGYMLVERLAPVAAWRKYRGMSQAELGRKAGLSQVWISKIESGAGHGTPATRRKLAEALDAPLWALDDTDL